MHAIELTQRIDRLERNNRRLWAALLGVVALALVAAVQPPGAVRATAFELVTDEGAVAGEWAAPGGYPAQYFRDAAAAVRELRDADACRALAVGDVDAAGIGLVKQRKPVHAGGVALHGPGSRGAAVLYYKDGGSLRFFDGDGAVTNEVRATPGPAR